MPDDGSRGASRQSVTWQDAEYEGNSPGQEANDHVMAAPANPFTMPNDEEIFLLRDQERERKKSEREARQNQKIWEKGTWTTRISVPRRALLEDAEGGDGGKVSKKHGAGGDMAAGGRRREKENLAEFISKKREMFLVQMSLDTKKAEIKKLEEAAKKREEMLDRSEKMLQEDQDKFEEFLKRNDKMAHQAIAKAEKETKAKQDKMQEIKKLNAQIMQIKSRKLKAQEALEDCNRYREFLESITPEEFKAEQLAAKAERREKYRKERHQKRSDWWHEKCAQEREEAKKRLEAELEAAPGARRPRRKKGGDEEEVVEDPPTPKTPDEEKGDSESDSDIPMYFTEPQQLLDIFANLEESNLFLIQNCQETEEGLEDLKQKFEAEKAKTHKETAELNRQMEELETQINAEKEKLAQLDARASSKKVDEKEKEEKNSKKDKKDKNGKEQPEDEDKSKKQAEYEQALNQKVTEVYERCIGDNESNIDAMAMLAQIEKNLEKLLDTISTMDPEFVAKEEAKRDKDRREERRAKQIEEKEREQQEKMAERQKRAAQPVQKKTGKTLMRRIMHSRRKKRDDGPEINDEEEDIKEFFA